jgi:hypothetical protein
MWQQAKTKITFVRQRVKTTLGGIEPTIKNLWNLMFGPKSKNWTVTGGKVLLDTRDMQKVLGTYCLAAAYNLSKTKVYNRHSFVNMDGLATEDTYQLF